MKILVLGCSHLGATLASTLVRSSTHDKPIVFVEIEKEQPNFEEVVFHELAKDMLELVCSITPALAEAYTEYVVFRTDQYSHHSTLGRAACAPIHSLQLIPRSRPPPRQRTE